MCVYVNECVRRWIERLLEVGSTSYQFPVTGSGYVFCTTPEKKKGNQLQVERRCGCRCAVAISAARDDGGRKVVVV